MNRTLATWKCLCLAVGQGVAEPKEILDRMVVLGAGFELTRKEAHRILNLRPRDLLKGMLVQTPPPCLSERH